jgi:protein SCO1/2
VTFASVVFLGLCGGGLIYYFENEKQAKTEKVTTDVKTTGKPALGGVPWVLVDSFGKLKTDKDYVGNDQFSLLYFGFTYCPDICPAELVKIGSIMNDLDKAGLGGSLKPVFISVDPNRDTVGQVSFVATSVARAVTRDC